MCLAIVELKSFLVCLQVTNIVFGLGVFGDNQI